MEDYGLSESRAISQMETQVASGRASGDLPPRLAAVHSGSEIHHDQGARVVVKMTDHGLADAMREHYASHGVPDVDIRIVPHTQRPLEGIQEEWQARLRDSRERHEDVHVKVAHGSSRDKVTVEFVEGPMNPLEAALLAEARAEPEVFEVIEVDDLPEPGVLTPTPGS